ncbi:MAG: anti-sigma factor family protein [Streptosporangiaceae bacterium]
MRGHVDAESLALCAEGLLSRRRNERIRAHVATCPECAAAQARLSEVPALLAQVPPPALPPGIAARLDAALSAEAARRTAQAPGIAPDRAAPARSPDAIPGPRAPRRRGPRLPVAARVLAVASVLAVAGGVGYVVARSSPSTSASSSAAPGTAAGPGRRAEARPDLRTPARGTTTFPVTHSGTRYQPHTFPAQAAGVLARSSTGLILPGSQPGQSRRSGPALTGCVTTVVGAGRAGEVKLVDQARYRGHPATVIVVAATSTQPGMVYVAGTSCSASDARILARAPLR